MHLLNRLSDQTRVSDVPTNQNHEMPKDAQKDRLVDAGHAEHSSRLGVIGLSADLQAGR